jgi:hypothetical protein
MSRYRKKSERTPNIRKEAKASAEEYDKNIDKLWSLIRSAGKEEKKKIIANLEEDVINALRTRQNPYKKPVFMGSNNKTLAFSVINMTEKYAQRMAVTSVVGFIYRMLDEYKPPGHDTYVSENDPKFAMPFNQKVREFKRTKPEELLSAQLAEVRKRLDLSSDTSDPDALKKYKEAAKDSYIIRAKLLKYRIYWVREDLNIIKEARERSQREVQDCELKRDTLLKTVEELKIKKDKKHKYEEKKMAENAARREKLQSGDVCDTPQLDGSIPDGMTAEDIQKKTSNYMIEIENKSKLAVKEEAKRVELAKELAIRDKQFHELETRLKLLNERFRELKVEFLKKTGRIKMAADLIKEGASGVKAASASAKKKSKARSSSVHTELDDLQVEKYELKEADYDSIAAEIKKSLGIEKTSEEYMIDIQNHIEHFLDEYFRYNPDNHVRCAYKPNYDDPQRTPLENTRAEDERNKNYERTVIPPDDTFFRFNRYQENNYECLRQATDDIYCEKSDFEFAVVPLETFEGKDEADVERQFNEFKRKYADEFDAEIFGASYGRWNLLSSWEQNREVRDFYTEKSEIIKRIIDQHKDDQRTGMKLVKDRMKKKREENEAQAGPHDPALQSYRKSMKPNAKLERHGGKYASELDLDDDFVTAEGEVNPASLPRDTDESNTDEIEVGVHVIKPYMGGGRRRIPRGEAEAFKFHIPAVPLEDGQVSLYTGPDFQDKHQDYIDDMAL